MRSIEIPHPEDRDWKYRFFEILPGALTYVILLLPVLLVLASPRTVAFFIIGYLLLWFIRLAALNFRAFQGFKKMNIHKKLPWRKLNADLEILKPNIKNAPDWHAKNLTRIAVTMADQRVTPSEVVHLVFVALYKEGREIIEPTIKDLVQTDYDSKKIIVVVAYEQRGGPEPKKTAAFLKKKYAKHFYHFETVEHPDNIPGEVPGKGGNLTYAGKQILPYLRKQQIDPKRVIVTSLDCDNRPDKQYFGALTYTFCSTQDPKHVSYQPIPLFLNNIWDAPAPMRVVATGNSFWNIILSMRIHLLRNFSSHAQPLEALIDTDFWSTRTVVEDGHQYWRTFFRYDGNHDVYPIYVPIYQDAVLTDKFLKTLKAQFYQVRRWAYGASDIAYVARQGFMLKNNVPRLRLIAKFIRLLEGHVSWATAPLIIFMAARVPIYIAPESYITNQLPLIASRLQQVALFGIVVSLYISMRSLPPKPERYKHRRTLWMVLQWVYLPITTIGYSASAAINSQTRLMFGWYLGKFDLTEKSVKK